MAGFKLSCDYCGEKTHISSPEQFKDLLNVKSDAKFTVSKDGIKCRKCGNKVVKPDEKRADTTG
jgi:rRNA maturation protein Nop10